MDKATTQKEREYARMVISHVISEYKAGIRSVLNGLFVTPFENKVIMVYWYTGRG